MADFLGVTLNYVVGGGYRGSPWSLKVENIDKSISRNASIIPLPTLTSLTNPFLNRPFAWALDLGMIQEFVILNGVCMDNEQDITVPTITQMEEIVRATSSGLHSALSNNSLLFNNGVEITVYNGFGQAGHPGSDLLTAVTSKYFGVITAWRAHRDAGNTWWSWTLTLGVCDWSHGNFY